MSAELVAERATTHGKWADTARLACGLKAELDAALMRRAGRGQQSLSPAQREALDMILAKVARIVSGDPNHPDHWDDIEGYARLGGGRDPGTDHPRPGPAAAQAADGIVCNCGMSVNPQCPSHGHWAAKRLPSSCAADCAHPAHGHRP